MNTIAITWQDIPEPEWGRAVLPFLDAVLAQLEHTNWDLSVVFCRDAVGLMPRLMYFRLSRAMNTMMKTGIFVLMPEIS